MSGRLREGVPHELHVRDSGQARCHAGHRIYDPTQGEMHGKLSSVRRSEEPRDGVSRASQCIQARGEHRCGSQGPCSVGPWFGHHERIRMGSPHHARGGLLRCCPDSSQSRAHMSVHLLKGMLCVLRAHGSVQVQYRADHHNDGRARCAWDDRLRNDNRGMALGDPISNKGSGAYQGTQS